METLWLWPPILRDFPKGTGSRDIESWWHSGGVHGGAFALGARVRVAYLTSFHRS